MTIAVLGAGVTGAAAAYALARGGADAVLIERREGPALEASFANGGQISPSHSDPWAQPGAAAKLLRWSFDADAPVRVRPEWNAAFWRWARLFIAACSAERAALNTERMLRAALYGRARLRAMAEETGAEYDRGTGGLLHVFRSARAFDAAKAQAARVSALGCPREPVDAKTCLEIEPALAGAGLAGGMFSPEDESGDAYAFSLSLWRAFQDLGGRARTGTEITALVVEGGRVRGVETSQGRIDADAVIVCLGWRTPHLLRPLGIEVPVLPAKGYSVTVPAAAGAAAAAGAGAGRAPRTAVIDDERKLVVSRLGGRVRAAGLAEIGRVTADVDSARADLVLRGGRALFPDGADWSAPEFWAGFRPQTPDSVPILGRTPVEGLFLNTGHGTLGWTMACGAGQALADLALGRTPELDLEGLDLSRFSR